MNGKCCHLAPHACTAWTAAKALDNLRLLLDGDFDLRQCLYDPMDFTVHFMTSTKAIILKIWNGGHLMQQSDQIQVPEGMVESLDWAQQPDLPEPTQFHLWEDLVKSILSFLHGAAFIDRGGDGSAHIPAGMLPQAQVSWWEDTLNYWIFGLQMSSEHICGDGCTYVLWIKTQQKPRMGHDRAAPPSHG